MAIAYTVYKFVSLLGQLSYRPVEHLIIHVLYVMVYNNTIHYALHLLLYALVVVCFRLAWPDRAFAEKKIAVWPPKTSGLYVLM